MRIAMTALFTVVGAAVFLVFVVSGLAATDPAYSGTAVVTMNSTLLDAGGKSIGTVQLHQDAAGVVLVRVDAAGIPAGAHGMHIHQTGKCEGPRLRRRAATSTRRTRSTARFADGAHGGDLAQIPLAFDGSGIHQATTDRVSLTAGPLNIADADGSALVIHATADDQLTDPTGNSGGRIACAVLSAGTGAPLPPNTGTGLSAGSSGRLAVYAGVAAIVGSIVLATARIARRSPRHQA